jgi:hypothetical protein
MRSPVVRDIEIRLAGRKEIRSVKFSGRPVNVTL